MSSFGFVHFYQFYFFGLCSVIEDSSEYGIGSLALNRSELLMNRFGIGKANQEKQTKKTIKFKINNKWIKQNNKQWQQKNSIIYVNEIVTQVIWSSDLCMLSAALMLPMWLFDDLVPHTSLNRIWVNTDRINARHFHLKYSISFHS